MIDKKVLKTKLKQLQELAQTNRIKTQNCDEISLAKTVDLLNDVYDDFDLMYDTLDELIEELD